MLAAAQALRQLGPTKSSEPRRIATASAVRQLTADLGEVITLHTVDDPRAASAAYPESDTPPSSLVVEALRRPPSSRRERRVPSA